LVAFGPVRHSTRTKQEPNLGEKKEKPSACH
jgi:hypothetical protein